MVLGVRQHFTRRATAARLAAATAIAGHFATPEDL
jgi:hypothetical protein